MIVAQRSINPVEKLYTYYDGFVISLDDMTALCPSSDEFEMLFELQRRLQKLDLNEEENCILAAMCVLYSGKLAEINANKFCLKQ
jgi:hypothetical protein